MAKRKTMNVWIREAMSDTDKDGPCVMMSLLHMVGQQPRELHCTKFSGAKSWMPEQLADMFRGKAETYSQDLPGVQTFNLVAFYGTSQEPQAFFPFLVKSESDGIGLVTEGPTEQGKLQQTMRWNEGLLSQVYRRQQTMDEFSLNLMSRLAQQNERLMQENHDAYSIVKELLMQKGLDDHNRKMEQLQFERASEERKKLIGFAPVLINTVLGREVFPTSTTDTVLIEAIAEHITEEQIGLLSQFLKPEVGGPLTARMHSHLERKRKEEEAKQEIRGMLANPGLDPLADAAGNANGHIPPPKRLQ